jgi:DNA-binding transcriptional ArsR family regulator
MGSCCGKSLLNQCKSFLSGNFFKAFSDNSRSEIVLLIMEHGQMTVGQVSEKVNINQSNVSRHLSMMHESGIMTKTKQGREVKYGLDFQSIKKNLNTFLDSLNSCC